MILSYFWRYRGQFFWILGNIILLNGCELLKPWPMKVIIDHILGGKVLDWDLVNNWSTQNILSGACVGLVLINIISGLLSLLYNYLTIRLGQKMVNELRSQLFHHLQHLSLAMHNHWSIGDLIYRVTSDTYTIQTLTMNSFLRIFSSILLAIGVVIIMVSLDQQLTLLALGVCPVLLFTVSLLKEKIRIAAQYSRQQESAVYSLVQLNLSAIPVIQAFTKETEEHQRFISASQKSLDASLRLYILQTIYGGASSSAIAFSTAIIIWIGTNHVLAGILTIGQMIVFITYLSFFYSRINNITQTWATIQSAQVGIKRVLEILELKPEIQEGSKVFPLVGAKGEIVWEGVNFSYHPEQTVLKKINLCVKPGEKVAIVGPTGAGKSTLVSLLVRFYDPQSGKITIDGINLKDLQIKSLRQQIAIVLQPPLIFPITIRENIAYSRTDANLDDIIQAAKLACIHEAIMKLPQGYDTLIGARGTTLSEGEKQRLTIARAILRNAPILILDEPTSSVDALTETLIMTGLEKLKNRPTTLIIAHRLSTVQNADRIIVMENGQIVEEGNFSKLIEKKEAFYQLYHRQLQEKQ